MKVLAYVLNLLCVITNIATSQQTQVGHETKVNESLAYINTAPECSDFSCIVASRPTCVLGHLPLL